MSSSSASEPPRISCRSRAILRRTPLTRPAYGAAAGFRPCGAHGKIDRGMIGRVEKQNLGRRDDERPFQRAGLFRQSFLKKRSERFADGAEPAQGNGRDRAGQRPVARIERAQPRMGVLAGKTLLERPAHRERIGEDLSRGDARGKTRRQRFGRRRGLARRASSEIARCAGGPGASRFRPHRIRERSPAKTIARMNANRPPRFRILTGQRRSIMAAGRAANRVVAEAFLARADGQEGD